MPQHTLFITGTDTGVGKTVVTAGLASAILASRQSVCVYKPIQTGSTEITLPEDPVQIQDWVDPDRVNGLATHCTYNFYPPATPYIADPNQTIQVDQIQADLKELQSQYDWVLVEGAGGVRVPIAPNLDMQDLILKLDLPALVVARPDLGTINHTLMTVTSLQDKGVKVLGVVVSNYPEETNDIAVQTLPEVFALFLPVPVLAYLPRLDLLSGTLGHETTEIDVFKPLLDSLQDRMNRILA